MTTDAFASRRDRAQREREVLAQLGADYRLRGFAFEVAGSDGSELLPRALADLRPDAVAAKDGGGVVIEVIEPGSAAAHDRLRRIRAALGHHGGWTLRVVYLAPVRRDRPASASEEQLAENLRRIGDIRDTSPEAALLLGWSVLEGLLQVREVGTGTAPRNARYVADALETFDYVTMAEAEKLRAIAALRNAVAHGQAHNGVRSEDLTLIGDVAERLMETALPAAE